METGWRKEGEAIDTGLRQFAEPLRWDGVGVAEHMETAEQLLTRSCFPLVGSHQLQVAVSQMSLADGLT